MERAGGPDLLDDAAPAEVRGAWRGWLVGCTALGLVVAGLVALRPAGQEPAPVALSLAGHTGHSLDGQQFVRLYFALAAEGGDAAIEQVEVVLGDVRQRGSAPAVIEAGAVGDVLVDLVPDCPGSLQALPAGMLEVTYRVAGDERLAELPLPIDGSLPRLVRGQCSEADVA